MFYALLNVLKHQVSLNRIQSLRVLSALLFKHPHNDLIIETFAQIDADEDHDEFVQMKPIDTKRCPKFSLGFFPISIWFI